MILRNSFRPWHAALWIAAAGSVFALAGCPSTGNGTDNTSSPTTDTSSGGNSASDNSTNSKPAPTAKPTPTIKPVILSVPGLKTVGKTDPIKLAVVTNNASDYWTICQRGVEKADDELTNTTVEFQKPANGTVEEQKTIVNTLLVKGVQGIAISPKDPDNETDFLNQTAAKALVVTQDSDAAKSKRAFYIGTDNHAAGLQAGEEIKKALPNGGTVAFFVGTLDAQNAADRKKGIEDALQGSNIKIGDTLTDETDRLKAKSNAASVLLKGSADCLVGLWSYNGPQILSAVRDANKQGKVKIVCFDEEDDTLAGVKSGDISATIVQDPYQFGYLSVKMMDQVIRGQAVGVPADKQMFVATRVIDKSTVDAFKDNLNKLRGR